MGKKFFSKKYVDQQWFWGLISEGEAEKLLKNDSPGTFLMRSEVVNKQTNLFVSFVFLSKFYHKQCILSGKKWLIEGKPNDKHNTICDLILFYQEHPISNTMKLGTPKPRPSWFIKSSDVNTMEDKILGAGNFSQVVLGKYLKKEVAVKKLFASEDAFMKEKELLMKEAKIMEQLKHPYIIKSFGIALDMLPPLIVMELMSGGLLSHLKKHGPQICVAEKLHFCRQLVTALAFMAEKKIVHRDLAARNCLFNKYGILKLTDFGLSDSEANLIAYCTALEQIPARWSAPETILPTATYNEKTDIFENGIEPLPHLNDSKDVIEALKKCPIDEKLHIPSRSAPPDFIRLLVSCWKWENSARPTFAELFTMIDMLIKNKYPLPPIEEMSVAKINKVWPLTTAEYEILVEYHLDSDNDSEDDETEQKSKSTAQTQSQLKKISNMRKKKSA